MIGFTVSLNRTCNYHVLVLKLPAFLIFDYMRGCGIQVIENEIIHLKKTRQL